MKRYVSEFANDKIRYYQEISEKFMEKDSEGKKLAEQIIENIRCRVQQCEYGYISEFEAIQLICKES